MAGTVWGQGGQIPAKHGARDVISVMSVTRGPASITVAIGDLREMTFRTQSHSPVSYFEMPFDSNTTGPVLVTLNGRTTIGPEITPKSGDEKVSVKMKSMSA